MLEPGVFGDRVIDSFNLVAGQPMNRSAEKHVLTPRELGMKPDAELDHRPDSRAPGDEQPAARRPVDGRNQLEERALSRSVPAAQPAGPRAIDEKRHVLERPEFLDRLPLLRMKKPEETNLELDGRVVSQLKLFGNPLRFDDWHYTCSMIRSSY